MKKYVFIIPSLSKGGAERVVSLLSNELIKNNKKVTIIVHYRCNDEYLVNDNVKVICLSNLYEDQYRSKMSSIYLLKLLSKLRTVVIREKADYIIPFLWTTCLRTELALFFNKNRKKIIHTVRNNPKSIPHNFFLRFIRNFMIFNSKKTIVQNKEQEKYFKHNNRKIFILPNPVPDELLNIRHQINKKCVKIIGVGRLEKQKNFELLVSAFANLGSEKSNAILYIYGEGNLRKSLQEKIDMYGLDSKIILKGRCNSYKEIYGDADVFVLSSDNEGMPNALLEAMAVGIPCISTNCPTGPSEIIKNNYNGILIDTKNVEQLVKSLQTLLNNQSMREKLGDNAKKYIANNYSIKKICSKFINICEK